MKFGENLKAIRKSKNISQEQLAEKLGVSRQSISKWETGENYPSMNNIICLCDIFNCKINELVHEDFSDINFLDEEIKMSVVKFKEKEQKRMKGLSKLFYILARIVKISVLIELILTVLFSVAIFIIVSNAKVNNNQIRVFNKTYNYKVEETKLKIGINDKENTIFYYNKGDANEIKKIINNSLFYKLSFITILSLTTTMALYVIYKFSINVEKLFLNIHDNETPFNSDNIYYLKQITLYLLLFLLIPDISGTIAGSIYNLELDTEINLTNYLFVIIVIIIVYIFKYGYEIQLDSKGKMYNK